MTTINLSGHRPFQKDKKTGLWISKLEYTRDDGVLVKGNSGDLYLRLIDLFRTYFERNPQIDTVISGCAMGVDLAGAKAAQILGLKTHMYVPYTGHGQDWKTFYKEEHNLIIEAADYVYAPNVPFSVTALLKRNEDMVDNADSVLALWDGSPGGTASCIRYAKSVDKEYVNLWKTWDKYKGRV